MLRLAIKKYEQNDLNDINFPTIITKKKLQNEGKYPFQINTNSVSAIITCQVKWQNIFINSSDIDGYLYISGPHRYDLQLELNNYVTVEPYKKIYKLDPTKLPKFDIDVFKITPSSKHKVSVSKSKISKIIQSDTHSLLCVNNNITYVLLDEDTGKYIHIKINISGDNKTICFYNGEDIKIDKLTISGQAHSRAILLDETSSFSGQSMDMLKTLDLSSLGIGGLKTQIVELLRRVFASRACHPEMIKSLNMTHVKGVLLYGPPGTGKTLIARQLGKMLNSVEPIIVNGPEIMSKYVGESAENVRKLFAQAESEYSVKGEYSQLHVIIFDEFDALAGKRTSGDNAGSQVGNQIVNQLLSKMDGINSLNNILIFGLTNRKELIDSALLRPGRFEVQLEINIPDEKGRCEIFDIHLEKSLRSGALSSTVKTSKLAQLTDNFTGAEIAGVIRNATTFAICRKINESDTKSFKLDKTDSITIESTDLEQAIYDTEPMFGRDNKVLDTISPPNLDLKLTNTQTQFISNCNKSLNQYLTDIKEYHGQSLKILLTGKSRSGKSTMAVKIARMFEENITNICYLSNFELIGQNDYAKTSKLKAIFERANTTGTSIVILDDIDNMMEVSDTKRGFIFNNTILQTLITLWSKLIHNKVIYITTAKKIKLIEDIGILETFHLKYEI